MSPTDAIRELHSLALKLEIQQRFEEREAVDAGIQALMQIKDHDSMSLANTIYESAKRANDMYERGLI